MKRAIIFVPGILQWWWRINWDAEAQTWFNLNTSEVDLIDRGDYFTTAIGRAFFQQKRVNRVKTVLRPYLALHDTSVSLVGHSNGTDIILKALHQMRWPKINALHLISGACEADFNKNGLNSAITDQRIGKVFVYVAGKDKALRLAHGWLGKLLGYGVLGLKGPINVLPSVEHFVGTTHECDYGHSDWFAPEHFAQTMQRIRRS